MREPREPAERLDDVALDLVEYFVVVLPAREALADVAASLVELVANARIRLLDVVVLARERDGSLEVLEIEDLDGLAGLRDVDGTVGLLSEHDLQLASHAVRPGT